MPRFTVFPPYSVPTEDECDSLRGVVAPGELCSLAFGIRSDRSIADVSLSPSGVAGPFGTRSGITVDLHIVKVWRQAGIGVYQSAPVTVAELLVKDDDQPLHDSYGRWCGHWRHLLRRRRYYRPPHIRLTGPARTSLRAGETKQVWASVRVPAGSAPGTYTGLIIATVGRTRCELPVSLEVLPLELLEPRQDLFLWYKGSLNCEAQQHYVPAHLFEAQLRDIYDHGFRSISLSESRADHLRQAISIARRIGFSCNVVLVEPFVDEVTAAEFAPMTPVYYVSDELDARGPAAVSHHVANWNVARRLNARTMVSLLNHVTTRRFDVAGDVGHRPDVVSLYLPRNQSYFARQESAARSMSYYWMSHMEKPIAHRVLTGLYLWRSGAAGISPYCYQHLPCFPGSPFNDFDEWEPAFHVGSEGRAFKHHMTTYPARGGPIPTLQWKGLSDGIMDLRYLTTLDALIDAAGSSSSERLRGKAHEARARADCFLEHVSLDAIEVTSETEPLPYPGVPPTAYQSFREQTARDAVALQQLLSDAAGNVLT